MKINSPTLMIAAVVAVYLGLSGNLQAAPPPATVPDGGSTGILLAAALGGLGFLKWKLKR